MSTYTAGTTPRQVAKQERRLKRQMRKEGAKRYQTSSDSEKEEAHKNVNARLKPKLQKFKQDRKNRGRKASDKMKAIARRFKERGRRKTKPIDSGWSRSDSPKNQPSTMGPWSLNKGTK